jgi:hypothetical protein
MGLVFVLLFLELVAWASMVASRGVAIMGHTGKHSFFLIKVFNQIIYLVCVVAQHRLLQYVMLSNSELDGVCPELRKHGNLFLEHMLRLGGVGRGIGYRALGEKSKLQIKAVLLTV